MYHALTSSNIRILFSSRARDKGRPSRSFQLSGWGPFELTSWGRVAGQYLSSMARLVPFELTSWGPTGLRAGAELLKEKVEEFLVVPRRGKGFML